MTPLAATIARWRARDQDRSLWDELPPDAAAARFSAGDQSPAGLLRLVELITEPGRAAEAGPLIDLVIAAEPASDPDFDLAELVGDVAPVWWAQALFSHPGPDNIVDVLAATVALTGGIDPQLRVWLADLDGPAACHFADAVTTEFASDLWSDDDWPTRARTWARTDAAVNGITLIGGVHLEPGQLSAVLDRII